VLTIRRLGLTCAIVVTLTASVRGLEPDPFEPCRQRFDRAPDNYDSAFCFYQVTLKGVPWQQAARVFDQLVQTHPANFWLRLAYGHVYRTRDPNRAEWLFRQAADGFASSKHAEGELLARTNLRNFLFPRGRVDEATRELNRVVEIGDASTDPVLKALAWSLLALHIQETGGDLGHAFRLLKSAEGALFPDGPYRLKRTNLASLGIVSAAAGRFDEALRYFHRLDDLATSEGDAQTQAIVRYNLFNTTTMRESLLPTFGGRERLLDMLQRALEAGEAAQQPIVMLRSHTALAELLAKEPARRAEALAHLASCLTLAQRAKQPYDEAVCSWIEASFFSSSDPRRSKQAAARAEDATARANNPRTSAFSAGRRMRLSWSTRPHSEAVRDALAAIEVVERLRELQDDTHSSAGLFSAWTLDYYWLSGQLLERGLDADVPLAFSVTERMRARSLLDILAGRQPNFAELDAVQKALAPDEALLSFQIGLWETFEGDFGGGAWVIAATRSGRTVHRLPDRVQLTDTVPVFQGLLEDGNGREAVAAARLYRDLLSAAVATLPPQVKKLVIVADGALLRLSFDALRETEASAPLAALYQLTSVPSATLWLQWRLSSPGTSSGRVLTLADPEPGRLPHAREESRAIARHVDAADTLLGASASEFAVKSRDLRRYDVVHVAAHAVADEEHPERSAILLSPGAASEDGLLQAREIESLDLNGRIVVLSACHTAGGAVLSGEGVLSLARAFFAAGASAVIGSRWPLRDADAADLFDTFYRHLSRGSSLSEALKASKDEARAAGRPASAWAALVVLGNGDLRPFAHIPASSSSRSQLPIALASSALAFLSVGIVLLRRRR